MDAAADYSAMRSALSNTNLPAYVSYVVRSHAAFDAVGGDDTTKIVVRTSDGKIIAGTPPKISIGSNHEFQNDVIRNSPFKPECYAATDARTTSFDGRPAEAIALRGICPSTRTTDHDHEHDTDFTTAYVDPETHHPIAVTGSTDEEYVSVRLAERFTDTAGFVLPQSFAVKVAGSGPMFWLNVDARLTYSDYRFSRSLRNSGTRGGSAKPDHGVPPLQCRSR